MLYELVWSCVAGVIVSLGLHQSINVKMIADNESMIDTDDNDSGITGD